MRSNSLVVRPRGITTLTLPAMLTAALVAASLGTSTTTFAAGRHDPLSAEEWRAACGQLLGEMASEAGNDVDCLPTRVLRRANRRKFELLLIERREPSKEQPDARYADIYFYDYRRDELNHYVTNLATRRLMSHEKLRNTQLPLTDNEVETARELIAADRDVSAALANEYLELTGELLSSFDQLDIKAFAFHASTLGGDAGPGLRRCGRHRCAQLSVAVRGVALEVQPVVDLSKRRVYDLARSRTSAAPLTRVRQSVRHHGNAEQ